MKALSVRQPWAWAIIYALKDIENRGWPIHYRGDILIHAAKTCTKKEYQVAREFCQGMGVVIPELISLRRGQVIGIVTIVDCKIASSHKLRLVGGCLGNITGSWRTREKSHQFLTLGDWGYLKYPMIWSWRWLHD
ncbi:MAG: ASCH domain-containing protein [Nostoc sp.]